MTTAKDKCLYFGLPGIAILTISLFITIQIEKDFPNNLLVKFSTFFGSNALGWLLYLILQGLLQEISIFLPYLQKPPIGNKRIETTKAEQEPPKMQNVFSNELYRQHNAEMERQRREDREALLSAICEYAQYTMSPYLREEDMPRLIDEIIAWAMNPSHTPNPIMLRNKILTSIDLRHFIWNIGERFGKRNGYDCTCRAEFVKRMFPDAMKETDIDSIRNFKIKSANGDRIRIDEPEKGSFAFHYPTATKSTQTTAEQPQKAPSSNDLQMIRKLL